MFSPIREVCREQGALLVDLDREFQDVDPRLIFSDPQLDPVHPNAEGHRRIARKLAPLIEIENDLSKRMDESGGESL